MLLLPASLRSASTFLQQTTRRLRLMSYICYLHVNAMDYKPPPPSFLEAEAGISHMSALQDRHYAPMQLDPQIA